MQIYACEVNRGTLCIDWLNGTIVSGKALLSMDDLREGYLKRERESRCRLLVMSSWPDDGALITRWKKANEARCTNLSFLTLYPESLGEFIFLKFVIFILFKHMVEIRRTVDIYTLLLPQCYLRHNYSMACVISS